MSAAAKRPHPWSPTFFSLHASHVGASPVLPSTCNFNFAMQMSFTNPMWPDCTSDVSEHWSSVIPLQSRVKSPATLWEERVVFCKVWFSQAAPAGHRSFVHSISQETVQTVFSAARGGLQLHTDGSSSCETFRFPEKRYSFQVDESRRFVSSSLFLHKLSNEVASYSAQPKKAHRR